LELWCLTKLYYTWLPWSFTLTAIQIWTPPYSFNFGFKYNTFILWDCKMIPSIKMGKETGSATWFMYSHSFQTISDIFLFIYYFCPAIATVVTVAEILKNNGLAVEKSEILYSLFLEMFPFCIIFLSNYWKIKLHSDGIFLQKSWHQQLTSKMILEEDQSRRPR